MLFIFGLLLLLIPTHTCVEMFCRFNQTDPCYTSLGHKLNLQMVMNTRNVELKFKKGTDSTGDPVFTVKNNQLMENIKYESIRNRSVFIFNKGTLIINSVIRSDSGTYRLEIYDLIGTQTHAVNLTVIVEVSPGEISLIVLGSVAVILILLVIIAYHFYKKKKQLKPTAESTPAADVENPAVCSHSTTKKEEEEEVQYGEMMFTPTVSNNPIKEKEECVYSQVLAH
ncbi:uncharacterized protein LOC127659618 [Xyrauchen texanus]|uniref:uncharacterized protein LOC127659618 n=1 Tax=Xyrauchen texanus TaxID=154827 RepID=UPI00224268BE|nr:uncharacterized protein LOC127659618 [Xyrauchen texanus]